MLQELVDLDGYYLEREPCTTCNDPEIPYSNLKLNNIKVYIHPVTYPTGRKVSLEFKFRHSAISEFAKFKPH